MLSANVLNKAIQFLSSMAITRMLTKVEYGLWSFVMNQYSYLGLISGLGLLSGVFQFATENRGKKEEFEYYRYCLKNGIFVNTVLVMGFLSITFFVDYSLEGTQLYLRAYVPLLLLEYALNLLLTVLRCENRIPEYAKIINTNTILNAIGTCGGAAFGIWGVIVGKYVANFFSVVHVLFKTKREFRKIREAEEIRWPTTKSLWHYSLLVGASSALNCLFYLIDISMIANLIGDPIQVATYKVATLIPTALSFIPTSVITALLPNIVQHNQDTMWLQKSLGKLFLSIGAFNIFLCSILCVTAPVIIGIVSGTQYLSAVPTFRILVVGYLFEGTFRCLSVNILAALRCVNYGFFLSVFSAMCDIVLNYMFIQKYGMAGAAYATLSSIVLSSALAFGYLLWRVYQKQRR